MTHRRKTIPADYFERLYRASPDPWQFETSAYERKKYAATLRLMRKEGYADALEVGCSIGVFTAQLAEHCDRVVAIDASEAALARARERCGSNTIRFERRMVPAEFPDGAFDLIVLSEVLYFLMPDDLIELARRCTGALRPGGGMVLCHWLGETDYPLTGQAASDLFAEAVVRRFPRRRIVHDRTYRLEQISA